MFVVRLFRIQFLLLVTILVLFLVISICKTCYFHFLPYYYSLKGPKIEVGHTKKRTDLVYKTDP